MELVGLVQAAQAGDLSAFGCVVERFQSMARAQAYAMLGDRHLAEDAVPEAAFRFSGSLAMEAESA